MGNAIEVKGLRKSFNNIEVLKGVNFEVRRGEIYALLGSNGAGKTTIVRTLTTLLKQDGEVPPSTALMSPRSLIMYASRSA